MSPRPKKVEGKDTKQEIFDAAVDLFAEKGYNAVSVRELTRKVGITEGSLYNHYKGKEDLLTAIFLYLKKELLGTSISYEDIESQIKQMKDPREFYFQSAMRFKESLDNQKISKIWRILALEQNNPEIAQFAYENLIANSKKYHAKIFAIMQKLNLIKDDLDPTFLADVYFSYYSSIFFENIILKREYTLFSEEIKDRTWKHVDFIWESIKK